MSEIVNDGAIIILASPVGDTIEVECLGKIPVPSRLRVWSALAGDTANFEAINAGSNSSCAVTVPLNQTSLIVAYRDKSGTLSSSLCADGGFSKDQWLSFFEQGLETPPKDRCFQTIHVAYASESIFGKFKLERPECAVHIPEYDSSFRRNKE